MKLKSSLETQPQKLTWKKIKRVNHKANKGVFINDSQSWLLRGVDLFKWAQYEKNQLCCGSFTMMDWVIKTYSLEIKKQGSDIKGFFLNDETVI